MGIKQTIIEDRNDYLHLLKEIRNYELPWPVGNCAEDETFAHLQLIENEFRFRARAPGMVAVTLTMDLKELGSNAPCKQCTELLKKSRSQFSVILNLSPPKGVENT